MIRTVSFTVGNSKYAYDLNRRGVALFGDTILKDTLLYGIERCLASDFSEYFTEQDKRYGTSYLGSFANISVSFDCGSFSYENSIVRSSLVSPLRCVRYAYGESIRAFTTSKTGYSSDVLDYTKFTSSDRPIWVTFAKSINKIVGCDIVSLVYTNSVLSNIEFSLMMLPSEVSRKEFELMYLILSEIFFSKEPIVVLLSDFSILSSRVLARFVDCILKQESVLSLVMSLPNNVKTILNNSSITEITV